MKLALFSLKLSFHTRTDQRRKILNLDQHTKGKTNSLIIFIKYSASFQKVPDVDASISRLENRALAGEVLPLSEGTINICTLYGTVAAPGNSAFSLFDFSGVSPSPAPSLAFSPPRDRSCNAETFPSPPR